MSECVLPSMRHCWERDKKTEQADFVFGVYVAGAAEMKVVVVVCVCGWGASMLPRSPSLYVTSTVFGSYSFPLESTLKPTTFAPALACCRCLALIWAAFSAAESSAVTCSTAASEGM